MFKIYLPILNIFYRENLRVGHGRVGHLRVWTFLYIYFKHFFQSAQETHIKYDTLLSNKLYT